MQPVYSEAALARAASGENALDALGKGAAVVVDLVALGGLPEHDAAEQGLALDVVVESVQVRGLDVALGSGSVLAGGNANDQLGVLAGSAGEVRGPVVVVECSALGLGAVDKVAGITLETKSVIIEVLE